MHRTADETQAVNETAWLFTAALLTGVLRGYPFSTMHGGGLFVDRYWAQYYLLNFSDGFHHRALMGTILRAIFPHGVSVLVINIIAAAAVALPLVLLLRLVRGLARQHSMFRVLAAVVVLSSCMVGVLAETMGDLLQLCFAVVVGASLLCLRVSSRMLATCIALVAAIVCMYLHEASLLLLVPALVIAGTKGRVHVVECMTACALLVLLLGWNAMHGNGDAHLTYAAYTFPRHGQMVVSDEIYKGFRELRQEDAAMFFATTKRRLLWVSRFGTVFLPAAASVVMMSYLYRADRFRRFFVILCWFFAVSLPVYVIAHDWPRFLTLTFLLAVQTEQMLQQNELSLEIPLSDTFGAWSERVRAWSARLGMGIAAALLLQLASFTDYRYMGMPVHVLFALLPILAGCLFVSRKATLLVSFRGASPCGTGTSAT
jgi:hypothetical protein